MDQDERTLLLSAAAEELLEAVQVLKQQTDKELDKLPRVVREVLLAVPGELRKGIEEGSTEILREVMRPAADEAKELVKSLKEVAAEAQAGAKALRRTGPTTGLYVLAFGLGVGLIGWAVMGYLVKSRTQELDQLGVDIARDRGTLAELRSETWGVELLKTDRQRIIILPKGVKYSHNGPMQDGSGRVGIVITP